MSVRSINTAPNLENIPHMLRSLAKDIEAGEDAAPRCVMVMAIYSGDESPSVYHFGQSLSRLEEVGAMMVCVGQALQQEVA